MSINYVYTKIVYDWNVEKCNESVPLTVEKYAHAERVGEANRKKNTNLISAEKYAKAIIRDGLKKGSIL